MTGTMTTTVFAVDYATLAREVAMDIFPLADVLKLHQLGDEEWREIQENPRFKTMLEEMIREWNSAASTKERVKIKAATGLESQLEEIVRGLSDQSIPYTQRIEGAKFLARVGELDAGVHAGAVGGGVTININTGSERVHIESQPTLDLEAIPEDET